MTCGRAEIASTAFILCPLTSQQLSVSSTKVSFWVGCMSWRLRAQFYGSPLPYSGAILFSLLFNIYTKSLDEVINHLWFGIIGNTQLYLSTLDSKWSCWCSVTMPEVWIGLDGEELSPTQSYQGQMAVDFCMSRSEHISSLTLDRVALLHWRVVHNLGVFLDSQLLFNEQVVAVTRNDFAQLHVIKRPFRQSLMPQLPHNLTTAMHSIWGFPWRPFGGRGNEAR